MVKTPQALLSITMSLNVRTRSLLLQKAHHTSMPHNADLHTRCSGNVAECVVINCAEIYGLHKVLSMPFYVRSLAGGVQVLVFLLNGPVSLDTFSLDTQSPLMV